MRGALMLAPSRVDPVSRMPLHANRRGVSATERRSVVPGCAGNRKTDGQADAERSIRVRVNAHQDVRPLRSGTRHCKSRVSCANDRRVTRTKVRRDARSRGMLPHTRQARQAERLKRRNRSDKTAARAAPVAVAPSCRAQFRRTEYRNEAGGVEMSCD